MNSFRYVLYLAAAFAVFPLYTRGQSLNPRITRLNNADGLSQNSVYYLLQDHKGFIWISTENGLNRYDGYSFRNYYHDRADKHSLSGSYTGHLIEDSERNLWVSTYGTGICKFDPKTERFQRFSDETDKHHYYSNNAVWYFLEEKPGVLWLGMFGGGLKRFDTRKGIITNRYLLDEKAQKGITGKDIRTIASDGDGKLWLGSLDGGLLRFDIKSERFESFPVTIGGKKEVLSNIVCMYNDQRRGCLWVGTHGNGLWVFQKKNRSWHQVSSVKNRFIRSIVSDPKNPTILWIADLKRGVLRLNVQTQQTISFSHDPNNANTLSGDHTLSLMYDRSGLLWVGTYWDGVNKLDVRRKPFRTIEKETPKQSGITSGTVSAIAEVGEQTWVGTNDHGITIWDRSTNIFTPFPDKGNQSISNNLIHFLMPDGPVIWTGTNEGLHRINTKTFESELYSPPHKEGIYSSFTCGLKDRNDRYWFGTYGSGLHLFDPKTEKFINYQQETKRPKSLSANVIFALFEDSRGQFWIGTSEGGLNRMNRNAGTFERMRSPLLSSQQTIHTIREDRAGNLWIATSSGLVRMTPNSNGDYTYRCFTIKDGLPDNFISGLLIDHNNQIWISGTKGVASIQPSSNPAGKPVVRIYTESSGIANREFTPSASCSGKSGLLYFGSVKGLVFFDPDNMQPQGAAPRIVLTGISIFNKPVELNPDVESSRIEKKNSGYVMGQEIGTAEVVELTYAENVFSLRFAALDFGTPSGNTYQVKMEGFNSNWLDIGTSTEATYTALLPGTYVFCVRGANSDGIWSKEITRLKITITPPWWATWWFRIGSTLLILLTIVYLIRRRISKLERDKQVLEAKVEERTIEINAQKDELLQVNEKLQELDRFKEAMTGMIVHDLKNPLNGIVNLTGSVQQLQENQPIVAHSAKQMLNMVMNILDVQQIKESRISLKPVSIFARRLGEQAVAYLYLSLEQKNIQLVLEFDENPIVRCDSTLMERVLINLIANAVQYSAINGTMTIGCKQVLGDTQQRALFYVKDEGAGMTADQVESLFSEDRKINRHKNKYSTGIGLQYCKWVLEAHESKLEVVSTLGVGSTFSFTLPCVGTEELTEGVAKDLDINIRDESIHFSGLSPILTELKSCQVFEGGKILGVLNRIEQGNKGVDEWKRQLKQAVFAVNQEQYDRLIEEGMNTWK